MRARSVMLIAIALVTLGFSQRAEAAQCYGGFTIGMATAGHVPTKQQREFLAHDHVEGTFDVERDSKPYGFFVGCELPHGFAIEGTHQREIHAQIDTHAALVFRSLFDGNLWVLAVPFTITERVNVETYSASMLWHFPPQNQTRGFVRAGIGYAFGELNAALIVDGTDLVDYHRERSKPYPYLGLGFEMRSQGGWLMRTEFQEYPCQVHMLQFSIGHRF